MYPEPKQIFLKVFHDNRGRFLETYNKKNLENHGITLDFCQDNYSFTAKKGTIRGLHFQTPPMEQAKLVLCLKGKIFDVIVDLRKQSPDYLKVQTFILDGDNPSCLYVPKGFAHGFCTLEDDVLVLYKVNEFYSPAEDGGILWSDPDLNVNWPLDGLQAIVSPKDAALPTLKQQNLPF